MTLTIESVLYLTCVALLWGATNPFIKRGAVGLENVKSSSRLKQFFKELAFLLSNPKYTIPFLINQSGSVLYFLTLSTTDISLALPVTNSLTFVITAVTGWILGEEKIHRNTYMGMALILAGTAVCCWDKTDNAVEI